MSFVGCLWLSREQRKFTFYAEVEKGVRKQTLRLGADGMTSGRAESRLYCYLIERSEQEQAGCLAFRWACGGGMTIFRYRSTDR